MKRLSSKKKVSKRARSPNATELVDRFIQEIRNLGKKIAANKVVREPSSVYQANLYGFFFFITFGIYQGNRQEIISMIQNEL